MKFLFSVILMAISFSVFAQYDIDIKVKDYDNDTIIIGNYYADKQLVKDTLIGENGKFEFEGTDTLDPGVYFVLLPTNNDFVQFFVNGIDNEFDLTWDLKNRSILKFKGSKDNELFAEYMQFLAEQRPVADKYRARLTIADSTGVKDEEAEMKLDEVDVKVIKKQQDLIEAMPESITSKFLKASKQLDFPEFEGEDKQFQTYRWYKKHYFDNIDLGDPVHLRTPYLHERIIYYTEKLTSQDPDSMIISVDYLLDQMEPAHGTYRYYLSFFLNKYAKLKIVGYDAVYVHLVDKYYAQGKADWVDEKSLEKMIDQAENFRPILIGKKFPDITTYKVDKTPVRVWDVDSPYTVLLFWAHDCGHCTKSMPDVVSFYEEYQDKGVTLISICTKGGEKMTPCQEAIPNKKMENFINTFDEYQRYRKSVYIPSTPKIFVLDKDKNILIKDIPAKELKNIMPHIIRIDNEKKITEER